MDITTPVRMGQNATKWGAFRVSRVLFNNNLLYCYNVILKNAPRFLGVRFELNIEAGLLEMMIGGKAFSTKVSGNSGVKPCCKSAENKREAVTWGAA